MTRIAQDDTWDVAAMVALPWRSSNVHYKQLCKRIRSLRRFGGQLTPTSVVRTKPAYACVQRSLGRRSRSQSMRRVDQRPDTAQPNAEDQNQNGEAVNAYLGSEVPRAQENLALPRKQTPRKGRMQRRGAIRTSFIAHRVQQLSAKAIDEREDLPQYLRLVRPKDVMI